MSLRFGKIKLPIIKSTRNDHGAGDFVDTKKKIGRERFLAEMEQVVPWPTRHWRMPFMAARYPHDC